MIRINLLSGKKAKRQEAGQRQLVYMGVGVLATVGALVFVNIGASNELEDLTRESNLIQADIDRMKGELGDYDKIKAQRENLMKQRNTIQALQTNRTGPVYLLRELSEILTPGKGPTFDRVSYEEMLRREPGNGFNSGWDTKKVWLDGFEEDQKRVKIRGAAKSSEDVAEFMKRLSASVFFGEMQFEGTSQVGAGGGSNAVKHVSFAISGQVEY